MADNLVNQSLDRRREERAAEQLIQDNVTRLADLATTNMEIWQKYFGFGAQVAHYWADALNARAKLHQPDDLDNPEPSRWLNQCARLRRGPRSCCCPARPLCAVRRGIENRWR